MNRLFRISALALLAVCLTFGSAYAADGDTYRDAYTSENSSGLWTFTNFNSTGLKTGIHTITAAADTTSSVTAARTGDLWVLSPTSVNVAGVGMILTLPTAAAGLTYRFATATNNTLAVRTASADDIIYYGYNNTTKVTSPASSGSTITLVGNTNAWYVANMSGGGVGSSTSPWVPGTR